MAELGLGDRKSFSGGGGLGIISRHASIRTLDQQQAQLLSEGEGTCTVRAQLLPVGLNRTEPTRDGSVDTFRPTAGTR